MIDILSLANLLHESIRVRGKADKEPDAALSSRLLVALEGSKPIRLERNDVYLCGRSLKHTSFPCMNEVQFAGTGKRQNGAERRQETSWRITDRIAKEKLFLFHLID